MNPSRIRILLVLSCLLAVAQPAAAQTLTEADRPEPPYQGSLPFFYDLYTFRGDDGGTLVVAAFAVAAGALERKRVGDVKAYRFDVSFVLSDTAARSVFRTDDTVFVAAPRSLPDEHLLYTQVAMEAPPSTHTVQRVIMTDPNAVGIGQLYDSGFPIPDYSGTRLMLSDIALGQPDPVGGLQRGDHSLAILPLARSPESSFDVYYEIYNLAPGHAYSTEITVEPVDSRSWKTGEAVVGLRFSGDAPAAPDGTLRELRRVTARLENGRYRLTITVLDQETGETASRSRLFEVRSGGRGASLVMALPRSSDGVRD